MYQEPLSDSSLGRWKTLALSSGAALGARRLLSLTDRRKLFFPLARALLRSSPASWRCEESAEIGGAAVITFRSFGS
jgi:hypothetical protein